MPEMPQAAPIPDRPPLHLKGGYLAIASPASISDACFSVPAVRALRTARPQGTIVILANENTAPLWRKIPGIDLVLEHHSSDSVRKIVPLLKNCAIPFDSAIAWEDSPAAQAFEKAEIKQRLGYPAGKLTKFLTDPVEVIREIGPIEHQVKHYLLFVQKLGADPFQPSNFEAPPRPPQPESFRIAIAPGSDFGPAAEWPLERFVQLAKEIAPHCEITILPSPSRPSPAAALAKTLGNPSLNLPLEGETLIDHLATCRGLIACDSSVAHLASLVGTPTLVLFGPNEPEWKRPLGRIHRVIRRHVPCSGCLLNKCPLDHRCMSEITVPEVVEELRALLQNP